MNVIHARRLGFCLFFVVVVVGGGGSGGGSGCCFCCCCLVCGFSFCGFFLFCFVLFCFVLVGWFFVCLFLQLAQICQGHERQDLYSVVSVSSLHKSQQHAKRISRTECLFPP